MILEKGECLLFDNSDDAEECLNILDDHGYLLWTGDTVKHVNSRCGIRWWHGGKYPQCCATMSAGAASLARLHGTVDDGDDKPTHYDVITSAEFRKRLQVTDVFVEDLL